VNRPVWRWRCIVWPVTRLLLWVVAVIVITIVMTLAGLDLPAAIGVVVGGLFVSRELLRWVFRGEAPPRDALGAA
jgi:hypothetical protein